VRAGDEKDGVPTAQSVNCRNEDPMQAGVEVASLRMPSLGVRRGSVYRHDNIEYQKFTSQDELGHFLVDHYKISTPKDRQFEVCHDERKDACGAREERSPCAGDTRQIRSS